MPLSRWVTYNDLLFIFPVLLGKCTAEIIGPIFTNDGFVARKCFLGSHNRNMMLATRLPFQTATSIIDNSIFTTVQALENVDNF